MCLVVEMNNRDLILRGQASIVDERLSRMDRLVELCGKRQINRGPRSVSALPGFGRLAHGRVSLQPRALGSQIPYPFTIQ